MQAITAAANYLGGKYLGLHDVCYTGTLPDVCWSLILESDFKIVFGQAMKVAVF
jgi:hypothetical protein